MRPVFRRSVFLRRVRAGSRGRRPWNPEPECRPEPDRRARARRLPSPRLPPDGISRADSAERILEAAVPRVHAASLLLFPESDPPRDREAREIAVRRSAVTVRSAPVCEFARFYFRAARTSSRRRASGKLRPGQAVPSGRTSSCGRMCAGGMSYARESQIARSRRERYASSENNSVS